ncbi:hypothetical protein KC316_g7965 [Hortaea werneckii]|nr:hypothetical protein KC324_g7899 [Hortaea werneckii]KAI7582265.1 hypothetical protein KC316_g7965 [Hortaea werneckii]
MASEPSEENIENVTAMLGMDRSTAIRYLKAKHNNVEAAVNAFFDGEDISKSEAASTWDESAWAADREGNTSADRNMQSLAAPTAPNSREPSPSKSDKPTSKDEEERMYQQALSQSMGMPFQQESGVVGSDGKETRFGPATKDHYDASQWAMVPRTSSTGEIIPDVDVERRKNGPGEPRLLKQMPEGDYLSNFVTICHAIAGARETMLMREFVKSSYGQDSEWWRGNAITMPRIVHTDSGRPIEPEADRYEELVSEVQRLMAFLDSSERSYASIAPLTQTDAIKDETPAITKSRTWLEHFIQQWILAAMSLAGEQRDVSRLFNTRTAAKTMNDDGDNLLFDLRADPPAGENTDLTELLDGALWAGDNLDDPNFIESPAEVIVFRLAHANPSASQLHVEVPAYFCMDKYLKENVEATMEPRQRIVDGSMRIRKLTEIENKLKTWKHPKKSEQLDPKVLLKHTHGHFSGSNKEKLLHGDMANGIATPDDDDAPPPHYAEIAQKLEQVIASVDDKLAVLASEKEKTRKAISDLSRNPLPELQGKEQHRYTLRGVATKPNVTYVLRPKEEDEDEDIAMEGEEGDSTPEGMQWWRLEYEVTGTGANITKTKTPDYDVLRAAELEHREVLLVYASDQINDISLHDPTLPPQLQQFVDDDNKLFKAELQAAAENAQPPAYSIDADDAMADVPRESIERKGSMDSMRAEGGDDDDRDRRMSLPSYGEERFFENSAYGLGPMEQQQQQQQQQRQEEMEDAGPVHEIRLDDDGSDGKEGGGHVEHVEMTEKAGHQSLIPGLGGGNQGSSGGDGKAESG